MGKVKKNKKKRIIIYSIIILFIIGICILKKTQTNWEKFLNCIICCKKNRDDSPRPQSEKSPLIKSSLIEKYPLIKKKQNNLIIERMSLYNSFHDNSFHDNKDKIEDKNEILSTNNYDNYNKYTIVNNDGKKLENIYFK